MSKFTTKFNKFQTFAFWIISEFKNNDLIQNDSELFNFIHLCDNDIDAKNSFYQYFIDNQTDLEKNIKSIIATNKKNNKINTKKSNTKRITTIHNDDNDNDNDNDNANNIIIHNLVVAARNNFDDTKEPTTNETESILTTTPDHDTKESTPKVAKEPTPKVAKEPKPKIVKEPKEKIVKEKVVKEKVVKEKVGKEKVVKEPKEKVVKEPKPKVVKEPKSKSKSKSKEEEEEEEESNEESKEKLPHHDLIEDVYDDEDNIHDEPHNLDDNDDEEILVEAINIDNIDYLVDENNNVYLDNIIIGSFHRINHSINFN